MTAQPPNVPNPLRTVLIGAARLMERHSVGISNYGMTRHHYRDTILRGPGVAFALMRHWVERESDGKYTLRLAERSLFAEVPDKAIMLLVVCEPSRPDGLVTELRPKDTLYALVVSEGRTLAIEVSKQAPAQSIRSDG